MSRHATRPGSGDYLSEMVTTGLLMDMEGCCCRFCMGEKAAMDGHRRVTGDTWGGWRNLATWAAIFAMVGLALWFVEMLGG